MSLTNKKNELFGKSKVSSGAAGSSNMSGKKPLTASTASSIFVISPEIKNQRVNEAKQHYEKAQEYLKTNIFKWSADHLAAAPIFEKSAGCYAAAGENENAKQMYILAANSHQASDAHAAAAVIIMKAAQVSNTQGNKEECADLYEKAAVSWANNGETEKAGDSFIKAAKAVEGSNSQRAWKLYKAASDILFPENTQKEQLGTLHPMTVEAVKDALKFLLKSHMIREALIFVERVVPLLEAQGYESAMCKAMLTQTILQLEFGDVVKAEQTYLQDHLSNNMYIRSTECRCAELFINAYKSYDNELLEIAQMSKDMHFQDMEVQQLARGLSLMTQRSANTSTKATAMTSVPETESVPQPHGALSDSSSTLQKSPPTGDETEYSVGRVLLVPPPEVEGDGSNLLGYSRERDELDDDEIDLT